MRWAGVANAILFGLILLGYGVSASQKFMQEKLAQVEKALQQKTRIFETRMKALPHDRDLLQAFDWNLEPAVQSQLSRHLFRGEVDVLQIAKKNDAQPLYESSLQDIKQDVKASTPESLEVGRLQLLKTTASHDAVMGYAVPFVGETVVRGFFRIDQAWLQAMLEIPSFLRFVGIAVDVRSNLRADLTFRQEHLTQFWRSFMELPLPTPILWMLGLTLLTLLLLQRSARKVMAKNRTIGNLQKNLETSEWADKRSREAGLATAQRLKILETEFEEMQIEKSKMLEDREKHRKHQALYEQMGRAQHVLYQKFLRWLELLDETMDIISVGLTDEAKNLAAFQSRWRQGVQDNAGGQLGVRRYFKQLSENVDAASGKSLLEKDLDDLGRKAELINDSAMNLALKISALKGGAILNIQLFEHWNQLFKDKKELASVELINVYRTLNHLLSVDQSFSSIDLFPPQIFGRGPVKLPKTSESLFTSLCYHAILSLLFETNASVGKRSLKLILKSTQKAGELIIQCHAASGLRVQRDHLEAMRHWDLATSLSESSQLRLDHQAPMMDHSSLTLSWDHPVEAAKPKPEIMISEETALPSPA